MDTADCQGDQASSLRTPDASGTYTEAVADATASLGLAGLAATGETDTTCCYALQDKV